MIKKTKILLLSIGIILCISAFTVAKVIQSSIVQTLEEPTIDNDFSVDNSNAMDVDSFVKIAHDAYQQNINITRQNEQLNLVLKSKDNTLSDFYNDNEKLLDIKSKGFKIKKEADVLTASFQVKNNTVNVPNDVLINIAKRIQK